MDGGGDCEMRKLLVLHCGNMVCCSHGCCCCCCCCCLLDSSAGTYLQRFDDDGDDCSCFDGDGCHHCCRPRNSCNGVAVVVAVVVALSIEIGK